MRTVVATILVLTLAGLSWGVVLVTPNSEPAFSSSNFLFCYLTNVSAKDVTVRIETLDTGGAAINDTGDVTAQPFVRQAALTAAADGPTICRFTVNASKRAVRAASCVFEPGVGCRATVAAQ